jgi:hypothetical protein
MNGYDETSKKACNYLVFFTLSYIVLGENKPLFFKAKAHWKTSPKRLSVVVSLLMKIIV